MTSKAVKLDDPLYDRLKHLAEARRRTPHWMMKEAIRQFVEREEESNAIRKESMERWEHLQKGGKTIPSEKVEAWLKSWGTSKEIPCPARSK